MIASALKRALVAGAGAAYLLSDTLVRLDRPKKGAERRRVLIVRMDGIGDFVLWLDAARAWRQLYPPDKFELTFLGQKIALPVAEAMGAFDHCWWLDRQRFVREPRYRRAQLGKIRRAGFDVLIQARHPRELLVEDAITRLSGAGERIGIENPKTTRLRSLSRRWYTRLVPPGDGSQAGDGPPMELRLNAHFLRALGLEGFRAGAPTLTLTEPLPGDLADTPYYVLFPGASWAPKRWPVESFARIAERLHAQTGWRGLVCGGPGEEALGDALVAQAAAPLENRMGGTSLMQLATLIAGARVLVSNDSSGAHMAAGVDTPCVCILGGGHYGRFLPYRLESPSERRLPLPVIHRMDCFGCDWKCVYPLAAGQPVPCIGGVSVDSVWQEVQRALGLLPGPAVAEAAIPPRPSEAMR